MKARSALSYFGIVWISALVAGCATAPSAPKKDYARIHEERPRSILVVPTLNNTINVPAPDFFLSTISRPFADRGYYVFPAFMVKRVLEDEGLSDAGLVHNVDARRLAKLFGCDSVLFVTIQQWDSKYLVISTQTTVKFDYKLKSCKTGDDLWSDTETRVYSPQANNNSGGGALAALLAQAIVAAMEKGAPNYMPLTMEANAAAAGALGRGLPAGPYLPALYQKDSAAYP